MRTTKNPHDALFKQVFGQTEHAAGLLKHILPAAIRDPIDWSTLRLEQGSFVDEELKDHHTDLLFAATIRGREALIYILFEHQSAADPRMPMRLLKYMIRVWDQLILEQATTTVVPVILPVVLHHSEHGWSTSTSFSELYDIDASTLAVIREHVPEFRFFLDDISLRSEAELRARAMTALGRLALFSLRYSRSARELFGGLRGWFDVANEVMRAPNGTLALAVVWRYMLNATKPSEREEAKMLLTQIDDSGIKREILSWADLEWEEGRQEGRQEGQRIVLERLLARKFGALPREALAALTNASISDLDAMTERFLTAQTLAEVLG